MHLLLRLNRVSLAPCQLTGRCLPGIQTAQVVQHDAAIEDRYYSECSCCHPALSGTLWCAKAAYSPGVCTSKADLSGAEMIMKAVAAPPTMMTACNYACGTMQTNPAPLQHHWCSCNAEWQHEYP